MKFDLLPIMIAECPSAVNSQLTDLSGVIASVDNTEINHDDLFTFENEDFVYCAPSDSGSPITITITFPEPILLLEIDVRGNDRPFPFSNQYVTTLSYSSEDDRTFIPYIRDTGSVVCK